MMRYFSLRPAWHGRWHLLSLLWVLGSMPAVAVQDRPRVPEPLRTWVPWVLEDQQRQRCPGEYRAATPRRCAWPGPLMLDLNRSGGRFAQDWRVYADTWVPLPGDAAHWPLEVRVDDRPATVTPRNGVPGLRIGRDRSPGADEAVAWDSEAGGPGGSIAPPAGAERRVTGLWRWSKLPEMLAVPAAVAALRLQVESRERPFPQRPKPDRLWLGADRPAAGAEETERLRIQVFRKIVDDIPLRMTTRLVLEVSGKPREGLLDRPLPEGFVPLAVHGPLGARLSRDGRLQVQLRAGRWTVEVKGRHAGPVERLRSGHPSHPAWPREEVWVFEPRNELRLVEIRGVEAVDPQRTDLPAEWKALAAYRLRPGESMHLHTLRRGDPDPLPDQLELRRDLWLDFDGRGYTARDVVRGTMSAGRRLDMVAPYRLGRVSVDGRDRVVTRPPDPTGEPAAEGATPSDVVDGTSGVELRTGRLDLNADSRLEGSLRRFDVLGWRQPMQEVSVTLHLLPGWKPMRVVGADRVSTTWLQRWTLLDLFVVLVAAVAVTRLYSWPLGLLTLLALGLTYHQPWAPHWLWINLLAALALARVVPPGRLARAVGVYRGLAAVALVLALLPFVVNEVRSALYPQLERGAAAAVLGGSLGAGGFGLGVTAVPSAVPSLGRTMVEEALPQSPASLDYSDLGDRYDAADDALRREIDPKAKVSTGPGVPEWRWRSIRMDWSGPVTPGQSLQLILLPPWATRLWQFAGVLAVGLLAVFLLRDRGGRARPKRRGSDASSGAAVATLGLLACLGASSWPAPVAAAEFPPQALLDELRQRLLAPPDCLPECAQYESLRLRPGIAEAELELVLHAGASVAVPLPGDARVWQPLELRIDDRPAPLVQPPGQHSLWTLADAGRHLVRYRVRLPDDPNGIAIPLPLVPHSVMVEAVGPWQVLGIDPDGVPRGQILLRRRLGPEDPGGDPSGTGARDQGNRRLPPFARVERTLRLGLEWSVHTRVVRDPESSADLLLAVPLLAGEAVTTPDIHVEDGRVQVNAGPGRKELVWESTLAQRPLLELTAPLPAPGEAAAWAELWRLDAGPVWHVRSEGLAPVQRQDAEGQWHPLWRPWPGERLMLHVSRPEGVAGNTLTLDSHRLRIRPGRRAGDATLTLALRASQGGQHRLRLPAGAQLQRLSIDGTPQPARSDDQGLLTLPVTPGSHRIEAGWQQPAEGGAILHLPRLDLGLPSVNSHLELAIPGDRWVLWVRGPALGPAVLIWGVLLVILALAVALGRSGFTPLGVWQWALLGIGLSQTTPLMATVVVAWLMALEVRRRRPAGHRLAFNLGQVGLALLTLAALAVLAYAVRGGLLGSPEMQIAGNGSSGEQLNWYQDRVAGSTPEASVVWVPITVYRVLMLLWALWLANALIGWLRWGWQCYGGGGLWRHLDLAAPEAGATTREGEDDPGGKPPRAPFKAFDKQP